MRRMSLALPLLFLLAVGTASAGPTVLSGPVSGIWLAGSVYMLTDYSYVPAGRSLLVQEGVQIIFLTDATFDIFGVFDALGTPTQPITVTAPDNWGGFFFTGDGVRTDTLRCVVAGQDGGLPRHVVRSEARSLVISGCQFTASHSCLEVSNAHLWADGNSFLTTALYSRTVTLQSLVPVSDFPPGTAPQNCLRNSIVAADVASVWVSPFERRFTTALDVESSNTTVVRDNTFSVQAPGYAYGVYYGEAEGSSPVGATISHCVITARTFNVQARGVVNAHEGDLDVQLCTIDVSGGPYAPVGVSASNRAQSYVNSSIIRLSAGSRFCLAEWGATVTVMHADLWMAVAALCSPSDPPPLIDLKGEAETGVVYGDGIFYEDPQFVQGCEWGDWSSPEAVRLYYSLHATSPCIDRGDVALGLDPDNTRPDVGCFYYSQTSSSPDRPVAAAASMLLAPFPNPFNSSAVIRFVLQRSGEVRVMAYDLLGRPVAQLAGGRYSPGDHVVLLDARGWATGLYFVTLDFEGLRAGTERLLLVR